MGSVNPINETILGNLSKIITAYNATEVLQILKYKAGYYASEIGSVINGTSINAVNMTIGVSRGPVPKGYVPALLAAYIVYALFLIYVIAQELSIIRSAYGRLRGGSFPSGRWTGPLPKISVIIPIKGEDIDAVVQAVKRLEAVDYPRELLEVIVVSDDDASYFEALKRALAKGVGVSLKLIRRDRAVGYKGGAVNYALKYASGEVVTILDVDTVLPRNYFKRALDYLAAGYDFVGAPFIGIPRVPTGFSRHLSTLFNILSEIQIRGRALLRMNNKGFYMIIGNNLTMFKRRLIEYGGLCHCKADDMDLAYKVWARGGRIGLMDIYVTTEIPSTYTAFRSQTIRWATNDMLVLKSRIREILLSGKNPYDVLDILMWLTKYPTAYIGLVSIVVTVIMQILNIIMPPLWLMALMVAADALGAILIVSILLVGVDMGYDALTVFKSLIVGGLTMYSLTFPLIAYLTKALIGDIPWMYTPKASKALMRQGFVIERLAFTLVALLSVVMLVVNHPILSLYMAVNAAIIWMGYNVDKPFSRLSLVGMGNARLNI